MDKRKTGIALFMTLMVIASIMSIIAVSFSYLEKVQKDAGTTSALIQSNLMYSSTVEVLKRFFPPKKDNSDKLNLIYTMPLILSEEKSDFSVNLTCQALMVGVPINWLNLQDSPAVQEKETLAKDIFTYIVNLYEIEEPNGLEEMLVQAITGNQLQQIDYKSRLKKQKGIVSKQQFYRIITNYAIVYDDPKALKIPWEKYFSFVPLSKTNKIDGVYPSAEFVSAAFDIPIEIVQDAWYKDPTISTGSTGTTVTLASFLRENNYPVANTKIYSTKALNAMHCEQKFLYQGRRYGFKFNYIEGRSNNFEFNGQE
jgi:hypothetical protein